GTMLQRMTTALMANADQPTATMIMVIDICNALVAKKVATQPKERSTMPARHTTVRLVRSASMATGSAASKKAMPAGNPMDPATPRDSSSTSMAYGVNWEQIADQVPFAPKTASKSSRR